MSAFKQIDLSRVRTIPIRKRKNKVRLNDFARVYRPRREAFSAFVRSLPRLLAAEELRLFVDDVVASRRRGKPVIVLIGAHVIKAGLSPLVVDLLQRGVVTCLSMNS